MDNPISTYSAFQQLMQTDPQPTRTISAERIQSFKATNGPLTLNYSAAPISDAHLDLFQQLADQAQVQAKYQRLRRGEIINVSEKRKVLHHQTRSAQDRGIYGAEQKRVADFAAKVHAGEYKGVTGKAFKSVVQIGIGGSDLGPRAMVIALERGARAAGTLKLEPYFIANVDPDDANGVLAKLDVETTLFIVVSKSGTTQETLANLEFVKSKAVAKGIPAEKLSQHFVAVTGKGSPMDNPANYLASFYIDDFIGGRFSSTSAVGGVVMSLVFGPDTFEAFLKGASALDEAATEPDVRKNITLLNACLGVYFRNKLNYPIKAVIPYSEALSRFPAHLQQMDCESNGKSVDITGKPVDYETGPMILGEPGTNGQHSFFQKIHQGTDVIPMEFILFRRPQVDSDLKTFGSTSHEKLIANCVAQVVALATGRDHQDPNEVFSGNRAATLITADQLTAETLGALLAFYENIVMFQGFMWNLNSFDQPGVQLGKILTGKVLAEGGCTDPVLSAMLAAV